ncbi:MAG: hypothetical protein IJB10_05000 [Clostridia bacterium]|nr:hypothetical protein [Clostridia bacterium]
MQEKISILCELIEHSSQANKLLLSNAIAMENGEIAEAQKFLKEATELLKVMINDVFVEAKEICYETDEEDDYDFSVLDLSKLLTVVTYNASALISSLSNNDSEAVIEILKKKVVLAINACVSLTSSILLN